MQSDPNSNPFTRCEQAPIPNNTFNFVTLYSDEEVNWSYSYINGIKTISGYVINKKINILRDEIIDRINRANITNE